MKTYMEKAVSKAEKKMERIIKKAFRKNTYSQLLLKKCVDYYNGDKSLHRCDEDRPYIKKKCQSCMASYKEELLNGIGTIYTEAFTNINKRLKQEKAPYRVSLYIEEESLMPIFDLGDFTDVRVEVHFLLSVEFLNPGEITKDDVAIA